MGRCVYMYTMPECTDVFTGRLELVGGVQADEDVRKVLGECLVIALGDDPEEAEVWLVCVLVHVLDVLKLVVHRTDRACSAPIS